MITIDTQQLIACLQRRKNKTIEVEIRKGALRATHFLWFGGRKIHDIGIDSQEVTWTPEEFLANYPSTY